MTDRYVATTGTNSGSGPIGSPWQTIQYANDNATAGDTIYVRGGSYSEGARITKQLTIARYQSEVPIFTSTTTTSPHGQKNAVFYVAADGVVLDGLTVRNYTAAVNGSNISVTSRTGNPGLTVKNCIVSGATNGHGIRSYDSDYLQVYDCQVFDNSIGISVESQNSVAQDFGRGVKIYRNTVHDNHFLSVKTVIPTTDDAGAQGINLLRVAGESGTPIEVYDNQCYNNYEWSYDYGYDGSGIEVFGSAWVDIYRNDIHDNPHCIETGTQTSSNFGGGLIPVTNINIHHNTFYRGTTIPRYRWYPTGTQWKADVRLATTANKTFNTGFANGQTIDGAGFPLVTGNRILIKNQTTSSQNGIYTVNASGAPTRATDADADGEIALMACKVTSGTANINKHFALTTGTTIAGSKTYTEIIPNSTQYADVGYGAGLLMAAGDDCTIVHNTFYNLDQYAFAISQLSVDPYGDTVDNLDFRNNIITTSGAKVDWVGILLGRALTGATIDYTLYQAGIGSAQLLKTFGDLAGASYTSVAAIQAATTFDDNSLTGDPAYLNAGAGDYRTGPTGAGVNAGVDIPGYTGEYSGVAPDIGYFEYNEGQANPAPNTTRRRGRRNVVR